MPARAVEDEGDALADPGPDGADGRQEEPIRVARRRPDEGVDVGPVVARLDGGDRALAERCPDAAQDRLEADAVLVHRPRLDRNGGMSRPHRAHGLREAPFLNASCAAGSAWAWLGRGTCGVCPRRRK